MIRVIRQHAMSAIELLGQQDPHQRMRKRQTRQGPFEVAPLQDIRGETIGPADEKGEIASVLQARSEPGRQLAGRHLHAVLVERDYIFASPESRKDSLTLGLDGFGRRLSGRAGARRDFGEGDLQPGAEPVADRDRRLDRGAVQAAMTPGR